MSIDNALSVISAIENLMKRIYADRSKVRKLNYIDKNKLGFFSKILIFQLLNRAFPYKKTVLIISFHFRLFVFIEHYYYIVLLDHH